MDIIGFSHNKFQRHVWDKFGNYSALEKLVQDKFKTFYCWLKLNVTKQLTCLGQVLKIRSLEISKLHNIFTYVISHPFLPKRIATRLEDSK